MIPLALAIRNGHVACTRHLIAAHYPPKWRRKKTEESILHLAARSGNMEIIRMVTDRASNSFLQSQDSDGLIPATAAIAYGHHHVLKQLLRGLKFAEKLHHEHLQTTYWCVLCLLDLCVGWSKGFQEGRTVALNRKGRNVFQRHRTEAGFSVSSDVGARAVMGRVLDSPEGRMCLVKWVTPEARTAARRGDRLKRPKEDLWLFYTQGLGSRSCLSHTLDTLQQWTGAGASPAVLESALATMQYANRGHRSELFLLLSHMTRFDAIRHVIRKGRDNLAAYLYSKLQPAFDAEQKQDFFRQACAQGLQSLVELMLSMETNVNLLSSSSEEKATPLDLALAFGHFRTAAVLLENLEGDAAAEGAVYELRALRPHLSVTIQWKLGMARVGDEEWASSFNLSPCRLSHLDLYLISVSEQVCFNVA